MLKFRFIQQRVKSFKNFTLSNNQLILTEEYDFYANDCPRVLEALQSLDNKLEAQDKTATLYFDDCPLQLQQEIVDYLVGHSFNNLKTVITCHSIEDLPEVQHFAQVKLEGNYYV